MRISFSVLSVWMSCPLQAKRKFIERLPEKPLNAKTYFGSAVHHSFEVYHKSNFNVELAVSAFKKAWSDPETLGVDPTTMTWAKYYSFGSLMEKGIAAIREYDEKSKWDSKRIVLSAESKFEVPIGPHTLSGIVDVLQLRRDSKGRENLSIIDLKTGAVPTVASLELNVQFTAYHYASYQPEFWDSIPGGRLWFKELENVPRTAIWYDVMNARERLVGPRSQADYERMYGAICEIANAIEKEVFVPNISGSSCSWCSYTKECGITIPESPWN